MSVVNKMLQDLEQRQTGEHRVSADYQPPKPSKRRAWIWAIVITLTLALLMAMYWPQLNDLINGEVLTDTPATDAAVPTPAREMRKQMVQAEPADPPQTDSQQALESSDDAQPAASAPVSDIPVTGQAVQPEDNESAEQVQDTSVFEVTRQSQQVDPATKLRQRIEHALETDDKAAAVRAMDALLLREPDNQILRKRLASLTFALQQFSRSEQLLKDGLQRDPQAIDFRLMLARFYFDRGQAQTAFEVLLEKQVSADLHTDYLSFRAALAEQLGRHEQAQRDFTQLLQADIEQPRWWLGLAVSLDRQQRLAEARDAYQRAARANQFTPQFDEAVMNFIRQRSLELESAL